MIFFTKKPAEPEASSIPILVPLVQLEETPVIPKRTSDSDGKYRRMRQTVEDHRVL